MRPRGRRLQGRQFSIGVDVCYRNHNVSCKFVYVYCIESLAHL